MGCLPAAVPCTDRGNVVGAASPPLYLDSYNTPEGLGLCLQLFVLLRLAAYLPTYLVVGLLRVRLRWPCFCFWCVSAAVGASVIAEQGCTAVPSLGRSLFLGLLSRPGHSVARCNTMLLILPVPVPVLLLGLCLLCLLLPLFLLSLGLPPLLLLLLLKMPRGGKKRSAASLYPLHPPLFLTRSPSPTTAHVPRSPLPAAAFPLATEISRGGFHGHLAWATLAAALTPHLCTPALCTPDP